MYLNGRSERGEKGYEPVVVGCSGQQDQADDLSKRGDGVAHSTFLTGFVGGRNAAAPILGAKTHFFSR